MADPSDEQLMLALRDGDLGAFDALFRRRYEMVRALCARLLGSGDGADDLAQETFLRILRHRATFRGDARFTTWAYRIARNVTLEHLTRVARERRTADAAAAEQGADADVEQVSLALDPAERLDILAEAMRRLAPEQREVIVLARYQDLPFEEVASILGCSVGAARVRAHRALAALRAVYASLVAPAPVEARRGARSP